MKPSLLILLGATLAATLAGAATIVIEPDRDATLIEDPAGALANGSGPAIFVGRTSQNSIRRAVVHFDLSTLPRNVVVDDVQLRLFASQASPANPVVGVHRLTREWGEGGSLAMGGGGVPAQPGDATWRFTFFDPLAPAPPTPPASRPSSGSLWVAPGGDFDADASASVVVPGTGWHSWTGPGLVADVMGWVAKPKRNHGWILLDQETAPSTARRFDSREGMLMANHPRLEITYHQHRQVRSFSSTPPVPPATFAVKP